MATVLFYGDKPFTPGSMQQFFEQKANTNKTTDSPSADVPQLDGGSEPAKPISEFLTGVSRGQRPEGYLQNNNSTSTIKATDFTGAIHDISPASSTQEPGSIGNGANEGMRKRRKVSQTVGKGVEVVEGDEAKTSSKSWFSKLQSTAKRKASMASTNTAMQPSAPVAQNTTGNAPHVGSSSLTQSLESTRSVPVSRMTESVNGGPAATRQHSVKVEEPTLENERGSLQRSGNSPRKQKLLQLTDNGKLLQSPKQTSSTIFEQGREQQEGSVVSNKLEHHFRAKKGKLVQSLPITLTYGRDDSSRRTVAHKIDLILSQPRVASKPKPALTAQNKVTHPFFLGKQVQRSVSALSHAPSLDTNKSDTENEDNRVTQQMKVVPWKDITFGSSKPPFLKSVPSLPPIWPPLFAHRVVPPGQFEYHSPHGDLSRKARKLKDSCVRMHQHEDILLNFIRSLPKQRTQMSSLQVPEKVLTTTSAAVQGLDRSFHDSATQSCIISKMRSRAVEAVSAFDRAEASGPSAWTQQFAPCGWQDVLQPSSRTFHDWLRGLAVHNVDSGKEHKSARGPPRKKRRLKKKTNELDDFIINDSETDHDGEVETKHALLIVGPHGCGKTASVHAVAKELGFEVFEIHAGMRRSAKDIFDRVGDMTQNHLVRGGDAQSRASSEVPDETQFTLSEEDHGNQSTLASFVGAKKESKRIKMTDAEQKSLPKKERKEQKQSLILFEEVDVLFEEDRGFWSGVQNLILQSRRPVIMTCNDLASVPLGELALHDILHYTPPSHTQVVKYLSYMTICEGHILDPAAIQALYSSKKNDLRATITELDFWCQMTVGSQQGGLDWMAEHPRGTCRENGSGQRLRTFSKDTFTTGLDLVPEPTQTVENVFHHFEDNARELIKDTYRTDTPKFPPKHASLQDYTIYANAQSDSDLLSDEYFSAITDMISPGARLSDSEYREAFTYRYLDRRNTAGEEQTPEKLFACLEPLMRDAPVFPPATGRLAPSIDTLTKTTSIDVAPFVRSIVAFEVQMDGQRRALAGGVVKKSRRTRASRAAAEGGSKASLRRERWFPEDLDASSVLATGGNWPQWYTHEDAPYAADSPGSASSAVMFPSEATIATS